MNDSDGGSALVGEESSKNLSENMSIDDISLMRVSFLNYVVSRERIFQKMDDELLDSALTETTATMDVCSKASICVGTGVPFRGIFHLIFLQAQKAWRDMGSGASNGSIRTSNWEWKGNQRLFRAERNILVHPLHESCETIWAVFLT